MSTSELGVEWDEMTGWVQEVSSTFVTGVNTALEQINGLALDEAQKAELRAQAYFDEFVRISESARLAADRAIAASNLRAAEVQTRIAIAFEQVAAERLSTTAANWLQSLAERSAANLARIGSRLGPLVDAAQLAQAAISGNLQRVGEVSASILGGALLGALALALLPEALVASLLGAIVVGITAALGSWLGEESFKRWGEDLSSSIADFFADAQRWFQRRDPLTLDLDGDGIESTGINPNNPILFDHDGDGVKHATGWISADDGFLVLDRNGNGTIDSGRELFGDSTQLPNGQTAEDGFAGLAAEDTDGDGAITAADARFSQLRVWRDLNQDGLSQSGELLTLQQLGIVSINVSSVEHNQPLANGNRLADLGTYVRSDGTQGTVGETHGTADVDLAENTFYREFPDQVPLAEGVLELPNVPGSGLVRDLWEAASLSTSLRGLLEQFSEATTRSEQLALIDQLLFEWAETAGMDSMEERANQSQYGLRWQQIGSAVNTWSGFMHAAPNGGSTGNSGGNAGSLMSPEEAAARINWEATLTRTRNLFTVLEAFNGRYFFALPDDPFGGAASGAQTFSMADPDDPGSGGGGGLVWPVVQLSIAQPQLDALDASYEVLRESIYGALALQTRLQPLIDMIVLAPDPNGPGMILEFQDLEGELQDRIQQNAVDGMADLIDLTRGLSRQLAGTAWNGWQLVDQNIRSLSSTPELQALYAQFGVQIANGTGALNGNGHSNILLGSANGESISAEGGDDALIAGAGNDYLYGGEGSDSLLGGAGNDGLYGGAGNDVLEGGTGNDHMRGEAGNDLYVFRRGDGQDTIDNYDTTADRSDVLRMGPGIGAHDVQLTLSGTSLVVAIRGTNDRVTISGFFDSDNRAINGIALADGEYWDLETLKAKVQSGTDGNDHLVGHDSGSALYGLTGDDLLEGGAGEDLLYDLWGANVLRGGAGDDSIHGNGTIEGGTGNDTITGTGGSNTYLFNVGDGQDTINEIGYASNPDTLSFGAGIAPASITLVRTGNDLTFRISETDQVKVKSWFTDPGCYGIERVQFADGTLWTTAQIQALVPQAYVATEAGETVEGWDGIDIIDGAGGNDTINAGGANDQLAGGDGNDTINAGVGNDVALGGAGNDTLNGDTGDDVLDGGADNDTLYDLWGANVLRGGAGDDSIHGIGTIEGGTGNDTITGTGGSNTYLFNVGDGQDTITDYGFGTNPDTLSFGAGIAPASITLVRSGNDLTFRVSETDQVTVKNWFTDSYYYPVERVQFADGTLWTTAQLQALVPQLYVASESGETIQGWDGIDLVDGAGGNDTINAGGANDQLAGGDGNDTINAGTGNDVALGGAGNDTLNGDTGDDVMEGGDGDDTFYDLWGANVARGGAGNDTINTYGTIEGGTGNDTLIGTGGSNTYLFNVGDGQDTISEIGYASNPDTLSFGAGIAPGDVTLVRSGNDLTFRISETDQVKVKNWFTDPGWYGIEQVQFADGTTWNTAAMQALVQVMYVGTESGETIQGWDGIDLIDGAGGNDTINAGVGNDTAFGGAGNDTLNGDTGDDLLDGGADNDTLYDLWGANVLRGAAGDDSIHGIGTIEGGTGNDTITGTGGSNTYLFNVGDGQDTITEIGYSTNPDTLSFGAGIAPANLTLVRSGNDLIFRVSETDQVKVKNWFTDPSWYGVERVQFADGTLWTMTQIMAQVPAQYVASESGETIQGWDGIDLIDGAGGNDTINAGGANDQLAGGDGNDTINAGVGNDTAFGGAGNDVLNGDTGDDVLDGGADNDTLYDLWGANVLRGGAGDDSIHGIGTTEGGTGNDTITGTGGSNTYVFNVGDGQDTITDYGFGTTPDTLSFGAGIAPAGITLVRSGNDLTFRVSETDQVTVKNWFTDSYYYAMERVQFADGTLWTTAQLQALVPQLYVASESGETIQGWDGIDVIDGAGGNDTINGAGGDDQLSGGDGNDTLNAGTGNDVLMGGAGNDTLNGDTGDDVMDGGDGDDTFYDLWGANVARGGAGNDTINTYGTIEGGTGNDTLTGTGGSNTYLFNVGDGQDTITEIGYSTNPDTLSFGAGITPGSVSLVRFGNDLTFRISETDQVTVKNWFSDPGWYGIERVQFADGTLWTTAQLQALVPQLYVGTESGETIQGWDGIDVIDGAGGNDTINGAGGNDQLAGGEGNDTINAGVGNDTAFGGAGNDTLNGDTGDDVMEGGDGDDTFCDLWGANVARGGAGNDTINTFGTIEGGTGNDTLTGTGGSNTYLFNVGDGQDTINEIGYASNPDTLSFVAGIAPADVTLVRSGNDLTFRVSDTDQVKVKNWFSDPGWYGIERVQFADGTLWTTAQLQALVPQLYVASESGETIQGWDGIDVIDGAGGNDTINGAGGNDQLTGGDGNDTLNLGVGNDVAFGGAGNDTLNGDTGDDVMEGGDGDDTFYDLWGANVARGGAGNDTINTYGTIEGGTGNDTLTGTGGSNTYLFNVGDGQDAINEIGYASNPDTLSFGAGIAPADVTLLRSGNDLTFRVSETDQVKVKNWFTDPGWYGVERVQFADGTLWTMTQIMAQVPAQYVASESGETINGWDGIDVIDGAGGNDTLNGYLGNDFLSGGAGTDQLNGGNGTNGNDLMQGGADADTLSDPTGNNLFDGGDGNDTLTGGHGSAARDLFIGGAGNDTITTGNGADVLVFARADGADIVLPSTGGGDTLSLGGGVAYADLSLRKNGNDLILDAGGGDQITFRDWYASTNNRSVVNLQMVAEAMNGFAAGGSDPLLDNSIEQFNFLGLVGRFDQTRAADPGLTSWALSNALLDFHTSGSDSAAFGGDLAYQHGLHRSLTGIGMAPAQAVLNDSQFAIQALTLHPLATLQTGAVRLA